MNRLILKRFQIPKSCLFIPSNSNSNFWIEQLNSIDSFFMTSKFPFHIWLLNIRDIPLNHIMCILGIMWHWYQILFPFDLKALNIINPWFMTSFELYNWFFALEIEYFNFSFTSHCKFVLWYFLKWVVFMIFLWYGKPWW